MIEFLIVLAIYFVVAFVSQFLFRQLQYKGKNLLLNQTYKKMIAHPITYFRNQDEGKLSSLLQNDVVTLGFNIATLSVIQSVQICSLLIYTFMMLYYQIGLGTVSYTHLDVYKRQGYSYSRCLITYAL